MIRAIAAEFDKMRTTRTFYGFIIAALVLALLPTILVGALVDFTDEDEGPLEVLLFFIGGLVQIFALLLGILAATTEFRHGTITPSLLVVPNRVRLMTAKLVAALGLALALGFVVGLIMVGSSAIFGSLRDFETGGRCSRSCSAPPWPPRSTRRWASGSACWCATRWARSSAS